ncbi:hypothetical protein V6N12_041892 [Hibiscus sabdariffa]|uniref:Uncharacterized protein n=1 Tax=Hibiscus sabdariffa TaxID=183260 RepID=A0ABR2ED66_9ROSI
MVIDVVVSATDSIHVGSADTALTSGGGSVAPVASTHVFTPEQYRQILELLDKESGVHAATHMAGITTNPSSQDWILDTGATCWSKPKDQS